MVEVKNPVFKVLWDRDNLPAFEVHAFNLEVGEPVRFTIEYNGDKRQGTVVVNSDGVITASMDEPRKPSAEIASSVSSLSASGSPKMRVQLTLKEPFPLIDWVGKTLLVTKGSISCRMKRQCLRDVAEYENTLELEEV
jgi:hypothetical protein